MIYGIIRHINIIFISLFIYSPLLFAEPIVSTVNNNYIYGSFFSSDLSATGYLVYDNLEDGMADTSATIGEWRLASNVEISTTGNRHVQSSYCIGKNFTGAYTVGFSGLGTITSQKWFCQYWFKIDSNWNWGDTLVGGGNQFLANIKLFRLWLTGVNENFVYATCGYGATPCLLYNIENVSDNGYKYVKYNYATQWTKNVWHLIQFQYSESDIGAKNGTIRTWVDGQLIDENTGIKTREDYTTYKPISLLGWYNSWAVDSGSNLPDTVYFDDYYANTSWCRVEIGNSQVYASCTHREIQIPTSWSDTSITITVNQGSFIDGALVYLFVIDSDGNASEGYPVIISGGQLSPPPIQANNLTANNVTFGG